MKHSIRLYSQRVSSLLAPFFGAILVVVFFTLLDPSKAASSETYKIILVQMVTVGLAGLGMTWVILSGGIDLSVGSAIALSSVAGATALHAGHGAFFAITVAILTGVSCGVYNGLLITALRLPPFIATLGTMGFYRGMAKWLGDNTSVRPPNTAGLAHWVHPFGTTTWLPESLRFAPAVWLLIAMTFVVAWALHYTVLGRHATAIGSNEATARLCGIRIQPTKIAIYGLSGALAGLAGMMLFARVTEGDPTIAQGLELDIIAAVVIGGASLSGGQASVFGTLAGAFMMAFLRNRCTAFSWPNYVQEIIVGHIIVVAVALDQWRAARTRR